MCSVNIKVHSFQHVSWGSGPGNTAVSKVKGTGKENSTVFLPTLKSIVFKGTLVLQNALQNYFPGSKKFGEYLILKQSFLGRHNWSFSNDKCFFFFLVK